MATPNSSVVEHSTVEVCRYRMAAGSTPAWESLFSDNPFGPKPNAKIMRPPRLELGTFRVLDERDNHYTKVTCHTPHNPRSHHKAPRRPIGLYCSIHSLSSRPPRIITPRSLILPTYMCSLDLTYRHKALSNHLLCLDLPSLSIVNLPLK